MLFKSVSSPLFIPLQDTQDSFFSEYLRIRKMFQHFQNFRKHGRPANCGLARIIPQWFIRPMWSSGSTLLIVLIFLQCIKLQHGHTPKIYTHIGPIPKSGWEIQSTGKISPPCFLLSAKFYCHSSNDATMHMG